MSDGRTHAGGQSTGQAADNASRLGIKRLVKAFDGVITHVITVFRRESGQTIRISHRIQTFGKQQHRRLDPVDNPPAFFARLHNRRRQIGQQGYRRITGLYAPLPVNRGGGRCAAFFFYHIRQCCIPIQFFTIKLATQRCHTLRFLRLNRIFQTF